MLVAAALMLRLGYFLGMPFPLGILVAERHPAGAVAWAWGLNGLFTVIGSLGSVLLGLAIGFQATILVAVAIYAAAGLAFAGLRRSIAEPAVDQVSRPRLPRSAATAVVVALVFLVPRTAGAQAPRPEDPPGWSLLPSLQAISLYEDNIVV